MIDAYLSGVANLQNGEMFIPEYFRVSTVEKAKKFGYAFSRGISSIAFSRNGDAPVETTRRLSENAVKVLDSNLPVDETTITQVDMIATRQRRTEDRTTIIGRLETVSVHGKVPSFTLYDPLLGTKIDCFFQEKDFKEIQSYLSTKPNRVEVTGMARYNKQGNPISINVEQYRKLKNQDELPQFRDLEGINLSGDLDPTEYIRRLRND